jgi:hypothetical protein
MPTVPKLLNLIKWNLMGLLRVIKHRFILGLNWIGKGRKTETNFEFLRKLRNLVKPKYYD